MLQLGDFALSRVIESEGPLLDPQTFLPDSNPEVFRRHAHWLAPRHVDPNTGLIVPDYHVPNLGGFGSVN